MILADTSVWIDHLRRADARLQQSLAQHRIVMHTMVLGELACGSLKDRTLRLRQWTALPRIGSVSDAQTLSFIEQERLMNRGLGFIDAHLLAAVVQAPGSRLWTHDRRLGEVAEELGVGA